jgi:hypothetical protein
MLLFAAGVGEAQIDELGLFLLEEVQGIGRRGQVDSLRYGAVWAKSGAARIVLVKPWPGSGALSYCNTRAKSERKATH